MKKYKGKITKFIYKNSSGYAGAIFKLFDSKVKKNILIFGIICAMQEDIVYEIEGYESIDNKYNKLVFKVQKYIKLTSFDREGTIKYLSSSLFPTIGKVLATHIVDHYKSDVFKKIADNFDELLKVKNITYEKAQIIFDVVKANFQKNELLDFFIAKNLKIDFLNFMHNDVADLNIVKNILQDDFYNYAYNNNFQNFLEIDKVALAFGQDPKGEKRISWWAHEIVKQNLFKTGDTFMNVEDFYNELINKFNLTTNELIKNLQYAKDKKILYFENENIYTKESYEDEFYISEKLVDFSKRKNWLPDNFDFEKNIEIVEKFISKNINIKDFHFNSEQTNAIKNFIYNNVSIITGGPGTGKTTVINGIVMMYELIYKDKNYAILTPTGRAATKIKENCNFPTLTIHRFLQATGNNEFEVNEKFPAYKNFIVLDESSMIDNHLFASLLRGIKGLNKILLVGDVDQLPSVSYGNLFEDLIKSQKFQISYLKENNRQVQYNDQANGIMELASLIKNDQINQENLKKLNNVSFYFSNNTNEILEKLKKIYLQIIKKENLNSLNDIQIITPMYKNNLGIDNLNSYIQDLVNPRSNNFYKNENIELRVNDKVMYLENDINLELANGDIGFVKKLNFINDKIKSLILTFNNREIELNSNYIKNLKLNYACSIHKTQGSEYDFCLIVLDNENKYSKFILNKKMIYTAATRAKKGLFILSSYNLFAHACFQKAKLRQTTLKEFINYFNNI